MDVGTPPAAELGTTMKQDFQEADHPGVLDLDAGDFAFPAGKGESQALEEREVDMNIEEFALQAGQAIGDHHQLLAQGRQILQPLVQAEVLHAIDANLQTKEGGEFLVHAGHQVFAVDAQRMVSVVELLDLAVQLAADPLKFAEPEKLGDLVRREAKQAQFTGTLEDLVDGERAPEDEIPTVFDLVEE